MEEASRPKRQGLKRPCYFDDPDVFEWEQDVSPSESKLPISKDAPPAALTRPRISQPVPPSVPLVRKTSPLAIPSLSAAPPAATTRPNIVNPTFRSGPPDADENESVHTDHSDTESDASDSCCSSDSEHDTNLDWDIWTHGLKAKHRLWGINDKDWTKKTDLDKWLRSKDGSTGEQYLMDLTAKVESGTITLEELEEELPPDYITSFWWALKPALERCKGQDVLAIVGHCPQYGVAFHSDPKNSPPEGSECLTDAIITAVANIVTLPCLWWDFRPDCRKIKAKKGETYAGCMALKSIEGRQCLRLNNLLVEMAASFFAIRIVSTLSFSTSANAFVGTLEGAHVTLSKHISRMRTDRSLAILLCKSLSETGLTDMSMAQAYSTLADFLRRAPGREAGRALVDLPALEETVFSFGGQVSNLEHLLGLELALEREREQSPKRRAKRIAKKKEHRQKEGYKAKAKEYRQRPEVRDKANARRRTPESRAKRNAKIRAQNPRKRSTSSQRTEARRTALANPGWSSSELARWFFNEYNIPVKSGTVRTWCKKWGDEHLDPSEDHDESDDESDDEDEDEDEDDDEMASATLDQMTNGAPADEK